MGGTQRREDQLYRTRSEEVKFELTIWRLRGVFKKEKVAEVRPSNPVAYWYFFL